MASEAVVLPRRDTVSIRDVLALAERFEERSKSIVFRDQPYMRQDMEMAAKALRGMARSFQESDRVPLTA